MAYKQCDNQIKQVVFFSTLTELSVKRKDLLAALTLVGSHRDNPEPDPLAVLHADDRLCIINTLN